MVVAAGLALAAIHRLPPEAASSASIDPVVVAQPGRVTYSISGSTHGANPPAPVSDGPAPVSDGPAPATGQAAPATGQAAPATGQASSPRSAVQPSHWAWILRTIGPGRPCLMPARLPGAAGISGRTELITASSPVQICPGVTGLSKEPAPSSASAPSPASVAQSAWAVSGTDWLPRPTLAGVPSRVLCGEPVTLPASGSERARYVRATPAGQLVITAIGHLEAVSLTYLVPGRYPIRPEETWTASWSLAGQRGVLPQLSTEGATRWIEVVAVGAVRSTG
jgi:hypothetical protein